MKIGCLIGLFCSMALAADSPQEVKLRAQKTFREAQLKASNDQISLGNAVMQAKASQESVIEEIARLAKALGCEGPVDPATADCKGKEAGETK